MIWLQNIGCMRKINGGDVLVNCTVALFPDGRVVVCDSSSLGRVVGSGNYSFLPGLTISVTDYRRMLDVYINKGNATVEDIVLKNAK